MAATVCSWLLVPSFFVIFRRLGELGQKPENELAPEGGNSDSSISTEPHNPYSNTEPTEAVTEQSEVSAEASNDTESTEAEEAETSPADEDDPAAQ